MYKFEYASLIQYHILSVIVSSGWRNKQQRQYYKQPNQRGFITGGHGDNNDNGGSGITAQCQGNQTLLL